MVAKPLGGYAGRVLRVNLTNERLSEESPDEATWRLCVGGVGLGAQYLYQEVPPAVEWNDPQNRLIWASGPLGGTIAKGTGTFCVVTKGPMTNLAVSTQANGFWGAFIKLCGYDAVVIEGAASRPMYLYVHDRGAELRPAGHLVGTDTWEMEDLIKKELGLGPHQASVFGIGPAGENLVRFAAIAGDQGHVAGHNGVGAVMGAKKLKAIVAARGRRRVPVHDPARLAQAAKEMAEDAKNSRGGLLHKWGTAGWFSPLHAMGAVPVKNYTTNVFPAYEKFDGHYLRAHFKIKRHACWACGINHCQMMEVTEGPYAGYQGEEPEYEGMAAWGPVIGNTDPGAAVMLSNLTDRLGMDINEAGWVTGWVMECYEKGLLTEKDTGGLKMTWGNVEGTAALLRQIAHREGFGAFLAEGVKVAAGRLGGEALSCAIFTRKGASPRGHDHRGLWSELLDTCLSNTSTIEVGGWTIHAEQLGLSPITDRFAPEQIATANAQLNGWRQFQDCTGLCRFCNENPQLLVNTLNAVTGWEFTVEEAMRVGRRAVNLLRAFNLRHGLTPDLEAPSPRYASTPADGPVAGKSVIPFFHEMRRNYWRHMGWDEEEGRPLPQTLRDLGLSELISDLWPERSTGGLK